VERRKLSQLFQRRSPRALDSLDNTPEFKALKSAEAASEPEIIDQADVYEPPGELATLVNSVSKLIVPSVKVDPWSIFWLVAVAITAGTGLLSVLLLTSVPPIPNCDRVSLLATDSERLYCAKLGAETNKKAKVIEAISLVRGWSEIDPLYNDGKNLLGDWSRQLLRLSKQELAAGGNLQQALADLKQIPVHSPVYKEVKETIDIWEEQWSEGKDIKVEFQKSLKDFDWNASYGYLAKVRSFKSAYWYRTQYHEMSLILAKEKDAWDKYQDAERIAKRRERLPEFYTNEPDELAKAMSVAADVHSNTYIKPQAIAQRAFWGRKLLAIAAAKYAAKDYGDVNDIAKRIPADLPTHAEAQDWIRLSNGPSETQKPTPKNALAQAHQIAQAGTFPALRQAMDLAKTIADKPLQAEAQHSIENWDSSLQYVTDRPLLEKARNLAKAGDLDGAIATAQTISSKRSLYRTAQSDIGVWKIQLPLQRDVKTYKAAEALFLKGKIQEAIDLGNQIAMDSQLYKPMQQSIKYWRTTLPKAGAKVPTKP
jgi:hypothetical protein